MHCFTAEEFANRGAHDGAAISGARIRRAAGAFQLQLKTTTNRCLRLSQADRPAIAQLTRPVTELMPAIIARPGLHPRQYRIAAQYAKPGLDTQITRIEPQLRGHLGCAGDQARCVDRGGFHTGIKRPLYLAAPTAGDAVAREITHESVVKQHQRLFVADSLCHRSVVVHGWGPSVPGRRVPVRSGHSLRRTHSIATHQNPRCADLAIGGTHAVDQHILA